MNTYIIASRLGKYPPRVTLATSGARSARSSPIIIRNSSDPSSKRNVDLRPYDRTRCYFQHARPTVPRALQRRNLTLVQRMFEHNACAALVRNSSNLSSRRNLDLRPYDRLHKVLLLACAANCIAGTTSAIT